MKIIYCDGSSLGNPGPGGFAVIALDTDRGLVWEYGEKESKATNNQMELSACLFGLKLILKSATKEKNFHTVEMRLDSKYVIQGVTEWSKNWVKNGWHNAQKKEVLNKDLWQKILAVKRDIEDLGINIKFIHVYGHTGEKWNERCDEIAKGFASGEPPELKKADKY
jgi:ribonuclease HI